MQPLMFTSSSYALVFWLVFLIWLAPQVVEILWNRRRSATSTAGQQDRGSLAVLIALLMVGIFLAFSWSGLPATTITWSGSVVFAIGVALMLLGVTLNWWVVSTLGGFFTPIVAVHPGQRVVERGPYRFVRHPAYSGTLLTLLGLGLAMTNWASLVAIVFCSLVGLLYRVRVEERELGQPYVEYMQRTRRFVPFVF